MIWSFGLHLLMMDIMLVMMVRALYSGFFHMDLMLVVMDRALCVLSLGSVILLLDIKLMMVGSRPLSNLALYLVICLALYLGMNLPHSVIYGSASNFDVRFLGVCGFQRTFGGWW